MILLKFILFFIIVFYIIKSVIRLMFPFLWTKQDQTNNPFFQNRQNTEKRDGEVTILNNSSTSSEPGKKDFSGGEYVDFEEIDD